MLLVGAEDAALDREAQAYRRRCRLLHPTRVKAILSRRPEGDVAAQFTT
jgi:hypothetical protein